jgi:hypothetical protein
VGWSKAVGLLEILGWWGLFDETSPDFLPLALACGKPLRGGELTVFSRVELEVLVPQRPQSIPLIAAMGLLESRGVDHPAKDVADQVVDQQR